MRDTSKKFAVVLAGCGNKDGAEIHESVLTLLAIDKARHTYQCFAPDIDQYRVLNFLTNEAMKEKRNVLVESARIARSNIKPLSEFDAEAFDILIFPGGSGVAYNLCTYAQDGVAMTIHQDVVKAVNAMHHAQKPIGALCIAPVIIAKLIPQVTLTFGQDEKANQAFKSIGVNPTNTTAEEIVIDTKNKVVTTPCYMLNARIRDVAIGVEKSIHALVHLT